MSDLAQSVRYLLAFFPTLALAWVLTPLAARLAHRLGVLDRPAQHRFHARPIYRRGTDHSSHRRARLGLSHRSVALVTYGLQLVCSAVAVWLVEASYRSVVFTAVGVVAFLGLIGFLAIRMDRVPESSLDLIDAGSDTAVRGSATA